MNSTEPLFQGAPTWLTLPFAAIAIGVLIALFILFRGVRLAGRRSAREEIEEYNERHEEEAPPQPIAPPAEPAPAEPLAAAHEPAAEPVPAPVAEPEPEPAAEIVPTPSPPVVEEAPAPEPLADEPIAAAAPLDASPASLAADIAEPPHSEPQPAPAEPEPDIAAAPSSSVDDLTRMKGVGPRLAERLSSVGIASFAQLAALTPEEANALDAKLGDFQGRIHRDRWIEQATFLGNGDISGFEETFGKL